MKNSNAPDNSTTRCMRPRRTQQRARRDRGRCSNPRPSTDSNLARDHSTNTAGVGSPKSRSSHALTHTLSRRPITTGDSTARANRNRHSPRARKSPRWCANSSTDHVRMLGCWSSSTNTLTTSKGGRCLHGRAAGNWRVTNARLGAGNRASHRPHCRPGPGRVPQTADDRPRLHRAERTAAVHKRPHIASTICRPISGAERTGDAVPPKSARGFSPARLAHCPFDQLRQRSCAPRQNGILEHLLGGKRFPRSP